MLYQLRGMEVVGVDCNDRSKAEVLRQLSQHHSGLAFEAADFDDYTIARSAGSHHPEKAGLVFEQETWYIFGGAPGLVEGGFESRWHKNRDHFIHLYREA